MRIARVLHAQSPTPIVALERDGALYDVAELDRHYGTRYAPEKLTGASDFHTRVIALSCAGLAELDDTLRAGRRPRDARLLPGSYSWLAPCATDRALYVQMGAYQAPGARPHVEPFYTIGNARGLLGHDATVPCPPREEEPDVELGLAAVLGEDIRRATAEQADKAILGYAVLGDWTARSEERRLGAGAARAKDFATQLGPVLVTRDELRDLAALGARLKIGTELLSCSSVGAATFQIAESVAFVSEHIELRAGDVIGAGCLDAGSARAHGRRIEYGQTVELSIDRIGRLAGRPVRGPDPVGWRRQ